MKISRERLNHFHFSHSTIQDNSLRPNFGGMPAVVEIDLMVRSMGPVSEVEMVRDSESNHDDVDSNIILDSNHELNEFL